MNLQQELSFKSKPNVWAYFSVKVDISIDALLYNVVDYVLTSYEYFFLQSGGGIHEFSDSQFGKLNEI